MYCNVCNKYRKYKKLKYHTFKENIESFYCLSKWNHEYEKIFKEEESIEILQILG